MSELDGSAWESSRLTMGTLASSEPQAFSSKLLRQKTNRHSYGYVSYVDKYLDYIIVSVVDKTSTVATWSGTHAECFHTWEPFILEGAA